MNENDEDVVHAGIVSKSLKIPEFRSILSFATHFAGHIACPTKAVGPDH
jgi:hypothetical protein